MPILALDHLGNLIETSPDREDGLGYGRSPEMVDQGDVTLGAAYLNAQARRTNEQMRLQTAQRKQDQLDAQRIAASKMKSQLTKVNQARREQIQIDPRVQQAQMKKAVQQKCTCDYKSPMGGNVMTANGMSGWAGMNRDQQTIHHVLSGMGRNVAHALDPVEARQAQMRGMAQKAMTMKARK